MCLSRWEVEVKGARLGMGESGIHLKAVLNASPLLATVLGIHGAADYMVALTDADRLDRCSL